MGIIILILFLFVSILEHLKPTELVKAFTEIYRVLKPGGQVVYGVPVERPFMVRLFRLLGYDIRLHPFSTEKDVATATMQVFQLGETKTMKALSVRIGSIYEIGCFNKEDK